MIYRSILTSFSILLGSYFVYKNILQTKLNTFQKLNSNSKILSDTKQKVVKFDIDKYSLNL